MRLYIYRWLLDRGFFRLRWWSVYVGYSLYLWNRWITAWEVTKRKRNILQYIPSHKPILLSELEVTIFITIISLPQFVYLWCSFLRSLVKAWTFSFLFLYFRMVPPLISTHIRTRRCLRLRDFCHFLWYHVPHS